MSRHRRPRVYGSLGCLGCSVPLIMAIAALVVYAIKTY